MMYRYEGVGVGGRRIRARFSGWGWSEGAASLSVLYPCGITGFSVFCCMLEVGTRLVGARSGRHGVDRVGKNPGQSSGHSAPNG